MSDSDLTVAVLRKLREEMNVRLEVIDNRLDALEHNAAEVDARCLATETGFQDYASQVMFTSKFVRRLDRRVEILEHKEPR